MFYETTIPVIKKYGESCQLNNENIKDIYFLMGCNNSINDAEITEYLERHHSIEEILCWNDEYINGKLDLCFSLLKTSDWESISTIGIETYNLCRAFTHERKTYERIIDFLKQFYKMYGYFMNYSFLKKTVNYPYKDKSFYPFKGIYIAKHGRLSDLELLGRSTGAEWRYLKDDGYFGMIPRFYKLDYKDLLDKLLTELIVPVFKHFYEESSIMKEHGIEYIQLAETVEEWNFRNIIKQYIDEFQIPVPEQIKKFL